MFGLLSLIGRYSELAPKEDDQGRPLSTSDLMGYSALGIVFGPLLVGGLIDSYSTKLADPAAGLVLLPVTPPPKTRHEKRRKSSASDRQPTTPLTVDKIHVANGITKMLITHWREVVRQMASLGVLGVQSSAEHGSGQTWSGPLASEAHADENTASLHSYPPSYRSHRRSNDDGVSLTCQTLGAASTGKFRSIIILFIILTFSNRNEAFEGAPATGCDT